MSSNRRIFSENQLLAALPQEEYKRLLPHLESISLNVKQFLYHPGEIIQYVYFPLNSVCSLVTVMEDGSSVEASTVGNEGMVGIAVFLGGDRIPIQAFCQISGDAVRMKAEVFKRLVFPGSALHEILLCYTQALISQLSQSVACNRLHSIEERFCRWLLMTRDRVGSDEFALTQEFLAIMLGVRRASVSEVAAVFQKNGIISYSRGKITLIAPKALETSTCECYQVIKGEYDRLLGD